MSGPEKAQSSGDEPKVNRGREKLRRWKLPGKYISGDIEKDARVNYAGLPSIGRDTARSPLYRRHR